MTGRVLFAPRGISLKTTQTARRPTPLRSREASPVPHRRFGPLAERQAETAIPPGGSSRETPSPGRLTLIATAERIAERAGRRSATPLCSALVPAFCAVGRGPRPPYRQKGTGLGVGRGDGPSITMVVGSVDRHSQAGCALCGGQIAPWGSPRRTGPWPAVAAASSHRPGLMAAPWRGARYAGVPRSVDTRGGPWHGPA